MCLVMTPETWHDKIYVGMARFSRINLPDLSSYEDVHQNCPSRSWVGNSAGPSLLVALVPQLRIQVQYSHPWLTQVETKKRNHSGSLWTELHRRCVLITIN